MLSGYIRQPMGLQKSWIRLHLQPEQVQCLSPDGVTGEVIRGNAISAAPGPFLKLCQLRDLCCLKISAEAVFHFVLLQKYLTLHIFKLCCCISPRCCKTSLSSKTSLHSASTRFSNSQWSTARTSEALLELSPL